MQRIEIRINAVQSKKGRVSINQTFQEIQEGYRFKIFRFYGAKDICEGALSAQRWIAAHTPELTIPATSISEARVERVPEQLKCPKSPAGAEDAQKVKEIPLL